MKNSFIIHRWGSKPDLDWYPWLKTELELKGYKVTVPEMPNTDEPQIKEWVFKINEILPIPDINTILIGHSIGCQAILRYLEQTSENVKVDQIILVAPWTKLKPIIKDEEGAEEIAEPWIKTPINWDAVRLKASEFITIFSDDDYYVYSEEAKLFKDKLGVKTLTLPNRGHFTEDDGVITLPEIFNYL